MSATKAIKQLFNFFEADVVKHFPEQAGGFVCPICLQLFLDTAMLSKAHLWPEALGGRVYTLACRKCNADIGTRIEKHEVERIKYLNLEKLPVREKIEGVEGHISSFYSVKDIDGQPTLIMENTEATARHSNPHTFAIKEQMFSTGEILTKEVTVSYEGKFDSRIAPLTYLHFAYISLFHLVGYQWVKTVQAAKIRSQLSKPKETFFPVIWNKIEREVVTKSAESDQPILFEVQGETALQGYFVGTPELPYNNGDRLIVWVPKLADAADAFLKTSSLANEHFRLKYLATICRKPGLHATC